MSYSLLAAERAQSQGGNYVTARMRMFKSESMRHLRIWTSRPNQQLHESVGKSEIRTTPRLLQ